MAAPCGSPAVPHLRWYYGVVRLLVHLFPLASGLPWRSVPPMVRRRWGSSPGFLGNPFGSMPRARDSGDPGATSHYRSFRVLPSALLTASASRPAEFSELNLRGLLPCCVRFAPTSRPVNGNTHYRPARSLWPGGTYTRWIPIRSFTVSSSVPPLPSFPSAITMSAMSSTIRAHDGMHSETERHFALVDGLRVSNRARSQSFGSGTQSDPVISSITYCITCQATSHPHGALFSPTQLFSVPAIFPDLICGSSVEIVVSIIDNG